eukprot:scaffold18541_cov67-Phaeocystis_antarctica.AAC.5
MSSTCTPNWRTPRAASAEASAAVGPKTRPAHSCARAVSSSSSLHPPTASLPPCADSPLLPRSSPQCVPPSAAVAAVTAAAACAWALSRPAPSAAAVGPDASNTAVSPRYAKLESRGSQATPNSAAPATTRSGAASGPVPAPASAASASAAWGRGGKRARARSTTVKSSITGCSLPSRFIPNMAGESTDASSRSRSCAETQRFATSSDPPPPPLLPLPAPPHTPPPEATSGASSGAASRCTTRTHRASVSRQQWLAAAVRPMSASGAPRTRSRQLSCRSIRRAHRSSAATARAATARAASSAAPTSSSTPSTSLAAPANLRSVGKTPGPLSESSSGDGGAAGVPSASHGLACSSASKRSPGRTLPWPGSSVRVTSLRSGSNACCASIPLTRSRSSRGGGGHCTGGVSSSSAASDGGAGTHPPASSSVQSACASSS